MHRSGKIAYAQLGLVLGELQSRRLHRELAVVEVGRQVGERVQRGVVAVLVVALHALDEVLQRLHQRQQMHK